MYQWLEQELESVKTRKFFIVHGRSGEGPEAPTQPLPESYRRFLRMFGKARFFRDGSGCYAMGVVDRPDLQILRGERYWRVGWYQEQSVLLKELPLTEQREWPAFEHAASSRPRHVAESFDAWLATRWTATKASFGPRTWKRIVAGPAPFSTEEMAIVQARKLFHWQLVDIAADCTLRIEVTNASDRRLPFSGLGVHGSRRGVWLGLAVPVGHIPPGQRAIVEHRGLISLGLVPSEVELFQEPDPGPEDRELRCEFRPLPERTPEPPPAS